MPTGYEVAVLRWLQSESSRIRLAPPASGRPGTLARPLGRPHHHVTPTHGGLFRSVCGAPRGDSDKYNHRLGTVLNIHGGQGTDVGAAAAEASAVLVVAAAFVDADVEGSAGVGDSLVVGDVVVVVAVAVVELVGYYRRVRSSMRWPHNFALQSH